MLEWNVWVGNFNTRKIAPYNIFNHYRFLEDCKKAYDKYGRGRTPDRGMFFEEVQSSLMYYFWSKCEWEVTMNHWPPFKDNEGEIKIDAYDQIKANWAAFCDYLWEHRSELKHLEY